MAYPKSVVKKVQNYYNDLKIANQSRRDRLEQEIYEKIPEIKEIDRMLSGVNAKIAQAAVSGGDVALLISEIRTENERMQGEKIKLLKKHGYPEDYLEPKYGCTTCSDSGYIDGKICRCFEKKLKEEAYKESNLPLVMAENSFENVNLDYYSDEGEQPTPRMRMMAILKVCRRYAENFGENSENLLMCGGTGLGKTLMSSCIAKKVLESGASVYYQPAYRIFQLFEEYKFEDSRKDALKVQIDDIFGSDLLIIDDLGTELATSYTAEVLFDLLNTRINNRKKMIINTNLDYDKLETIYSPRITSRLSGEFRHLEFVGDDIRALKK